MFVQIEYPYVMIIKLVSYIKLKFLKILRGSDQKFYLFLISNFDKIEIYRKSKRFRTQNFARRYRVNGF